DDHGKDPTSANADKAEATKATAREVTQLLKGNTTLLVWLVFLALGGGILALYYARIGYLPDIEWSSSIVYLGVASFIGGGIGLLFALSLLLPGLIWTECLLYDRHLVGVFCFDRPGAEPEPCVRTVLYYLGIPFLITLLVSHIALRMDALPALVAGTGVSVLLPIVYMIVSAAILSLTFFGMKRIFRLLLIVGRFKYMGVVRHGVLKGHSLKRSRLSLDLKDRHSESGDEE